MARTKFTLIERPDCRPTAVPTSLLQDIKDRGEIVTTERSISLAEIKRLGVLVTTEAQWKADWDNRARLEAFEAYRAKWHGVERDAEVLWFNEMSGDGAIRFLDDGSRHVIYACNIAGRKTWYPETACVFYERGQVVRAKLDIHVGQTFVLGVTPGIVDQTKWDSLDQDRLAFRCDEHGNAVTGLFAP